MPAVFCYVDRYMNIHQISALLRLEDDDDRVDRTDRL